MSDHVKILGSTSSDDLVYLSMLKPYYEQYSTAYDMVDHQMNDYLTSLGLEETLTVRGRIFSLFIDGLEQKIKFWDEIYDQNKHKRIKRSYRCTRAFRTMVNTTDPKNAKDFDLDANRCFLGLGLHESLMTKAKYYLVDENDIDNIYFPGCNHVVR